MIASAARSSTTANVSRKVRIRSGARRPTRASIPSANAVSVDMAVRRRPASVEDEKDGDRHDHSAEAGQHRHRQASALAQLAQVELAARLQPDHEEEERHQAAVHPGVQILRQAGAAEPDGQLCIPHALVGRGAHVRPRERGDRRAEQHRGAAGLGPQEPAQRGLATACPRGVVGCGRDRPGFSHPWILAYRRAPQPSRQARCRRRQPPAVWYVRCRTPVPNDSDPASFSPTWAPSVPNRRLPWPTTTGNWSRWNSSSRPWRSSQSTSVPLPLMLMFRPGRCLSLLISSATLPPIRVEFCHSALSRVVDTTTFSKLFIRSAIPPVWPPKESANPW